MSKQQYTIKDLVWEKDGEGMVAYDPWNRVYWIKVEVDPETSGVLFAMIEHTGENRVGHTVASIEKGKALANTYNAAMLEEYLEDV